MADEKKDKKKAGRPKGSGKGVPQPDRTLELIEGVITEPSKFGHGEKTQNEARILSWQWAVEGGDQTPLQWLRNQGYSDTAIRNYFAVLGGADEFRNRRRQLQDQVTEKLSRRYVDKIAEMSEAHLKSSNLIHLKAVEFLTKLTIEPARDKAGKIIMDGKGKPVFRGIRSQDLVNAAMAVKDSQVIMRKALGISDRDEFGLQQILQKIEQKQEIHNTQININVEADKKEKEIAKAVEKLSYEDIVDLIKAKRRRARELEAKRAEVEEDLEKE